MITPTKEFLKIFKETNGALSVCESIAIMNLTSQVSDSPRCVEFGVYEGKSVMSASFGLRRCMFYLVDPEFRSRAWINKVKLNLSLFESYITFSFHGVTSIEWLNDFDSGLDYVFLDSGSHQDGLPMQEVKLLEDIIVPNGIIAFHDFDSQFKEVREAYNYLLSTGKYEEIKIDWQPIIDYVKEHDLEKWNTSWHHTEMEFPCFVGALKRK